MASCKHLVFAANMILLLGVASGPAVLAQRAREAEGTSKQVVADSTTRAQSNVNPETAAVPNAPAPSEDKNTSDRLPFMANTERESHEQAPSATGLLLRTLGALLLIVGLIVAAAWGMKRFGGARFGAPKEDAPELAVLNSIALGERRSLAIVRFGPRILLLGSTPHSVTLLAENEIENTVPRIQSVADILSETSATPFADELSTATGYLRKPVWKGDEAVQW